MGVKQLWDLLAPTGTRVDVSTLAGKRVAVDASIWLVQFIKAMRDEHTGEVVKNAHLQGFFRRITRLLCNRVRPVFVFDGATPALKRHTVAARRLQRKNAESRIKSVAEKLVLQRLREHAARLKASGTAAAPAAALADAAEALPAEPAAPAYDYAFDPAAADAAVLDEEEDDDDGDFGIELPALGEGEVVDMEALAALPQSLQLDFMQRHREAQTAANRARFAKASEEAPAAFSAAQMEAYIAGGRVKRQLSALVREGAGADAMRVQRVAGDTTQEFVFDKRAGRDAGPPLPGRSPPAALRQPPPEPRFAFSALHPVLPPPMAGTVAPPPAASLPPTPAADEAEEATVPAAPSAVQVSFDIPACVDGDDGDEWEDVAVAEVAPAAAAAAAAGAPLMAAAEAADLLAAALAQAEEAAGVPEPAAGGAAEEAVALPSRRRVFNRSHGFLNGRSLGEWDDGVAAHGGPPPASDAEEQRNLDLAIQLSLSDAAAAAQPKKKARTQSGVVISLLEDDDRAPAAAAHRLPPSPLRLQRASSPIVVDDDDDVAAGAGAAGFDEEAEEADLRAAIAASLGQAPPAAPALSAAEVSVHSRGAVWRLSLPELASLAGNLSNHWPRWLPSPLELDDTPCALRCAGQEWEVGTPMEDCLLRIVAQARAAAAKGKGAQQPPQQQPPRKQAPKPMPMPMPPPRPPPAPAALPEAAPAWGAQWENVSSVWRPPAAAQPPRAPAAPPAPGARAATAEEEAELRAMEVEEAAAREEAMAAQFARERAALQAEHRSAARAADSVTPEMYAEVQDMLTMFGIPFIIAPAEAEAQCAWLDAAGLVDGVVTDDSDVFLFGARTVYRNIFDAKKYVELYSADRVRHRLGLDRTRLALLALLLGSDYTPGVPGVGPVNAAEIVAAFPSMDALRRFKAWVDAPESDRVAEAAAKLAGGRRGARAKLASPDKDKDKDKADEGATVAEAEEGGAAAASPVAAPLSDDGGAGPAAEAEFKRTHRGRRKAWSLADSFPAQAVVDAYLKPAVNTSRQRFEWGRPDAGALRQLCRDTLGWSQPELEKLLDRVVQEYDIGETQRTVDSFFPAQQAEQPFAKLRSKRLRRAVAGLAGRDDPDLALGDLEAPPAKKPRKARVPKPKKAKPKKPLLASSDEDDDDPDSDADDEYKPAPRAARMARKAAAAGAAGGAAAEVIVLDDKDDAGDAV